MGLTENILKQIEQVGYHTGEVTQDGYRVIVAEPGVPIDPEEPPGPKRFRQMVRIDGTDEESRYRAACQLALQCGIDLEDG